MCLRKGGLQLVFKTDPLFVVPPQNRKQHSPGNSRKRVTQDHVYKTTMHELPNTKQTSSEYGKGV